MEHKLYIHTIDRDNASTGTVDIKSMTPVGSIILNTNESDYYKKLSSALNNLLPIYLKDNKLEQFIPYKKPSIEKGETISVCYYHDKNVYDTIYEQLSNGYILMPAGKLLHELENLYLAHGLNGWYDKRSNPCEE